jgi:hypothetical protein
MGHVFEPAASGRSKCKACGRALAKGELRFGERLPNPFAEGTEITQWFHPKCAAYKRAEAVLEALSQSGTVADAEQLQSIARAVMERPRVARIDGAERAKGVATCRHCREPIERGSWRIRISMFDEGMLNPLGFIHLACGTAYCEGGEVLERILHFAPDLTDADRTELGEALQAADSSRSRSE